MLRKLPPPRFTHPPKGGWFPDPLPTAIQLEKAVAQAKESLRVAEVRLRSFRDDWLPYIRQGGGKVQRPGRQEEASAAFGVPRTELAIHRFRAHVDKAKQGLVRASRDRARGFRWESLRDPPADRFAVVVTYAPFRESWVSGAAFRAQKGRMPNFLGVDGKEREYWLFGNDLWVTAEHLQPEEVLALLTEKENRVRARVAKAMAARDQAAVISAGVEGRASIPDDVKIFVWRRDEGRCVRCGSQVELEFDHIIPLVMGGANTARNLQLLCATCNRAKGGELA